MGKNVWIVTASLTGIVAWAGVIWAPSAWVAGLLVGAGWGLANAWCLSKAAQCWVEGKKGWRLTSWLALKFLGLYGSLALFLVVLRISPLGWLTGFSLSLVGLALGAYR